MAKSEKIAVCYVLAYKDPGYVRTKALLAILKSIDSLNLKTAINKHRGVLRYLETPTKVLWIRLRHRPDVYIIGFSGYEIFWPVRWLTWPKPIIFDEFINAYDWFTREHNVIKEGTLLSGALRWFLRSIMKSTHTVLTDTKLHAQSSSKTYGIPLDKYRAIYVGTDEALFKPTSKAANKNEFTVFFYGSFLPLHGVDYILAAAKELRALPIKFIIIGGANKEQETARFMRYLKRNQLTNIQHHLWVNFDKLPAYIAKADLCLGGPFGDTRQSQRVITGKTFQFLAMAKATIIGRIDEEVGLLDKQNCLLTKQGDSAALAVIIQWAYQQRASLPEIGIAGRQLYQSRFSTSAQKGTLKSVIETAAG